MANGGRKSQRSPSGTKGNVRSKGGGRTRAKDRDRRLAALLDQTSNAVLRFRGRELAPAGISAIEAEVLFVLENSEAPTTPAEISRWTLRGADATCRLIQRMEAKGLVTKSKDLDRGNLVRVSMTDKGREAYARSLAQWSADHPISRLSDRQKEQLDNLLRKMLQGCHSEFHVKRNTPYP